MRRQTSDAPQQGEMGGASGAEEEALLRQADNSRNIFRAGSPASFLRSSVKEGGKLYTLSDVKCSNTFWAIELVG